MTRLSGFEQLSGDEWQDLCLRVLHEHHPGPELMEIPDDDRGDAGLEAFSLTGYAYQCYAPEGEPLSMSERLRKQQRKMTDDVGKFISNAAKIKDLLPPDLKITHWVLLVPNITSKRLVEHASRKTAEIRAATLAYADDDITVVPLTLDSFEAARLAVVRRQLAKLALPPLDPPDFSGLADEQIGRMRTKLAMTAQYADTAKREKLVKRLLINHVGGRAHRDHVSDHYSELGDELELRLSDLEERLTLEYALTEPAPDRRLVTVLKDTERTVEKVLNTHMPQSRIIAEGQVADWLMRCPLDFA